MKFLFALLSIYTVYFVAATNSAAVKEGGEDQWKFVGEQRLPGELRIVNEGLTHDDTHWYLSNKRILFKTSLDPIRIEKQNIHAIPKELHDLGYFHIGDIDIIQGEPVIYGGVESNKGGNGIIATWSTETLNMTRYTITQQSDMPWVAVDPSTRLLYSAIWGDTKNLQVYSAETLEFIKTMPLAEGYTLPKDVQGGSFYQGYLYVCSNVEDSVWRVDVKTGETQHVLSDKMHKNIKFDYEMEGITFWDLREKEGRAQQGAGGVMHLYGNFMSLLEKSIRSFDPVTESV